MHKANSLMKLGPVRVTTLHDYRFLFMTLVWVLGACALAVWAYYDGLLATAYDKLGMFFSIVFAVIIVRGLIKGIWVSQSISRGLNALKVGEANASAEAKKLLDVDDLNAYEFPVLQEMLKDALAKRIRLIKHLANQSPVIGFGGTVFGLTLMSARFALMTSVEEGLRQLPNIGADMALAFSTTLAGIIAKLILDEVGLTAYDGAVALKNRVYRTLLAERGSSVAKEGD